MTSAKARIQNFHTPGINGTRKREEEERRGTRKTSMANVETGSYMKDNKFTIDVG